MSATEQLPNSESPSLGGVELSQLVLDRPASVELLERLGLDYCCGGSQTLADACDDRGLDLATITILLESLDDSPEGSLVDSHDVSGLSISELCDHIVAEHHVPLYKNLEQSGELVETVVRVHGGEHPELADLERIYSTLSSDFIEHAKREEQRLFPFCKSLDDGSETTEIDPDLIALLEDEHSATGSALAELRTLSHEYDSKQAFCSTHRAMMASLRELELDTHLHVHEENNVLFPMVRSRLANA